MTATDPLHKASPDDSPHNAWRAGYRHAWNDAANGIPSRKDEANPYPEVASTALATISADDRGIVIDALIQHKRDSELRKIGNPASTVDERVLACDRMIIALADASLSPVAPQAVESEPVEPAPQDASGWGPIPMYAMLDIWVSLYGADHSEEFEPYAETHGYAETWARLCAAIRERSSMRWWLPVPESDEDPTARRPNESFEAWGARQPQPVVPEPNQPVAGGDDRAESIASLLHEQGVKDRDPALTEAARVIRSLLSRRPALPAPESEWEYGWEADESVRATMNPRGPKIQMDGYLDTPEALARFPKGRRIRRRKAGPWESVHTEPGEQA